VNIEINIWNSNLSYLNLTNWTNCFSAMILGGGVIGIEAEGAESGGVGGVEARGRSRRGRIRGGPVGGVDAECSNAVIQ
jgi:hypothetical protein